MTAGCRQGTPLGTTARSPELGTASQWVEDTLGGGVTGWHGTPLGACWDQARTPAAPGCLSPVPRHVSMCHPRLDGVLSLASTR